MKKPAPVYTEQALEKAAGEVVSWIPRQGFRSEVLRQELSAILDLFCVGESFEKMTKIGLRFQAV
jgi:hypothetical protein